MEKFSKILFRKTKDSLVWHFREDCSRFPRVSGYIVKKLRLPLSFQMICIRCKILSKAEE